MYTQQPLLTSIDLAGLALKNRIVMAPLTRMRSGNAALLPTGLHAEYYAQRAAAGLIISEGVWISPASVGWARVPGLYSREQVDAWRIVTEAVHAAGGVIFAQLWHTGAMSHPDFFAGRAPMAPSAVNPLQKSVTETGKKDTTTPQAMSRSDIQTTINDYAIAAKNAIKAGFDGVQIQAGFLYLISQFLNPRTNLRADEYGGLIENRARLLFDVLDAVARNVDSNRIGVKAGPAVPETGMFTSTDGALADAEYVLNRLNGYGLSHLLLMSAIADLSATPIPELAGDAMFQHFRHVFRGNIIANVGFTQERGNRLISDGMVDMVAFGQPFISNPDLPARFAQNAPLAEIDYATIYDGGPMGYTDYPPLAASPKIPNLTTAGRS